MDARPIWRFTESVGPGAAVGRRPAKERTTLGKRARGHSGVGDHSISGVGGAAREGWCDKGVRDLPRKSSATEVATPNRTRDFPVVMTHQPRSRMAQDRAPSNRSKGRLHFRVRRDVVRCRPGRKPSVVQGLSGVGRAGPGPRPLQ